MGVISGPPTDLKSTSNFRRAQRGICEKKVKNINQKSNKLLMRRAAKQSICFAQSLWIKDNLVLETF
jgi:hypothetical protein